MTTSGLDLEELLERWKRKLFSKDAPDWPPVIGPTVHYSKRNTWGKHIEWLDWDSRKIWGHFPLGNLAVGSLFVWRLQGGGAAVFQVTELEWKNDPRDMFFGRARDIGYARDHLDLLDERTAALIAQEKANG